MLANSFSKSAAVGPFGNIEGFGYREWLHFLLGIAGSSSVQCRFLGLNSSSTHWSQNSSPSLLSVESAVEIKDFENKGLGFSVGGLARVPAES